MIFRARRELLHKGGVFGFELFDFKIKLRPRIDFFVNLAAHAAACFFETENDAVFGCRLRKHERRPSGSDLAGGDCSEKVCHNDIPFGGFRFYTDIIT